MRLADGPNQTPAVVVVQDAGGPMVNIIGGASRLETVVSRIAAGVGQDSSLSAQDVAKRSKAIALAIIEEINNPTEPAQ